MPARTAVPAPVLVLSGIVSVQFGAALAQTLIPRIGPSGSVLMRLALATPFLLLMVRPRWRGYDRRAWLTVGAFGLTLGVMNSVFYGALAHLPIGVAVTVEFVGPLTLAAFTSRRPLDLLAVGAAGVGVVLISEILTVPLADLSWIGLVLSLTAGGLWACYIILSRRTGAAFPQLDGLALAMVVASLVVVPLGVRSIPQWTWGDIGRGFGIAILSSILPYSLELVALRRMSQSAFGILLSMEPAVAALAGLVVLGQRLDALQLVGIALVVGASTAVLGARDSRAAPAGAPDPAEGDESGEVGRLDEIGEATGGA